MTTLLNILDTPLGFVVGSLTLIAAAVSVYVLSMPLKQSCKCPRYDIQSQDGKRWIRKTFHRPPCEVAND